MQSLWFASPVLNQSNNRTRFHIQLQLDLCCPPVPSVRVCACACLCVSVTEGVAATNTHIQTCSSWQIKMNSVVFGSGSPFIIFHFTQRGSQTSAAACHVKTLYQALTAPPMHTPHAWLIHTLPVFKPPPTDSSTYAGSICSDLSH